MSVASHKQGRFRRAGSHDCCVYTCRDALLTVTTRSHLSTIARQQTWGQHAKQEHCSTRAGVEAASAPQAPRGLLRYLLLCRSQETMTALRQTRLQQAPVPAVLRPWDRRGSPILPDIEGVEGVFTVLRVGISKAMRQGSRPFYHSPAGFESSPGSSVKSYWKVLEPRRSLMPSGAPCPLCMACPW